VEQYAFVRLLARAGEGERGGGVAGVVGTFTGGTGVPEFSPVPVDAGQEAFLYPFEGAWTKRRFRARSWTIPNGSSSEWIRCWNTRARWRGRN
jgi:hypothetical protein